ncbi:MAG: ester cyclase [Actinobacteria bacterium]|nr:ester cyclase [Actinomycetota bacterium]
MSEPRVREYWRRVWSEQDVAFAREFYAPRFVQNDRETTVEAFGKGAAAFLEHFEDFGATIDRVFACDDVVVTRVVYRARHVRDFPGVPAVGAPIEVTGLDIFRFEDGLVVEHLHEADHEAMWEQLGVALPPG